MTSDPLFSVAVVGIALVLLFAVARGVIDLASRTTLRAPRSVPFRVIQRREISMQQLVGPGVFTLFTGLLISISASFLFSALTDSAAENAALIGFVLFVAAFVVFLVLAGIWLRHGVEVADIAREPATIAAAARSLHGEDPEDAEALRTLHRNLREWAALRGVRAFATGKKKPSPALNAAFARLHADGPVRWRTSFRCLSPSLVGATLRAFPSFALGPAVAVLGAGVALWRITVLRDELERIEAAAFGATVIVFLLAALLGVVFAWWSVLFCAARRYEIESTPHGAAQAALENARARIWKRDARSLRSTVVAMALAGMATTVVSTSVGRLLSRGHNR